jgi:hypothetical protein
VFNYRERKKKQLEKRERERERNKKGREKKVETNSSLLQSGVKYSSQKHGKGHGEDERKERAPPLGQ